MTERTLPGHEARYTTQELINIKCLIDRELYRRKHEESGDMEEERGGGRVTLLKIPHKYNTQQIFDIVRLYGAVKRIEWLKDKQGRQINRMYVYFWCQADAINLYKRGFYDSKEHPAFIHSVVVDQTA